MFTSLASSGTSSNLTAKYCLDSSSPVNVNVNTLSSSVASPIWVATVSFITALVFSGKSLNVIV